MDPLIITAAVCLLISLALAWLASLIIYAGLQPLKKTFPAPHQIVRAHIDYLLMTGLLVVTFFLCQHRQVELPTAMVWTTVFGALYNPFGFIVLAMKPEMANPQTIREKLFILIGFMPATIGYGYAMIAVLRTYL